MHLLYLQITKFSQLINISCTFPKLFFAEKPSLSRLEQMQRTLSGFSVCSKARYIPLQSFQPLLCRDYRLFLLKIRNWFVIRYGPLFGVYLLSGIQYTVAVTPAVIGSVIIIWRDYRLFLMKIRNWFVICYGPLFGVSTFGSIVGIRIRILALQNSKYLG